MSQILKLTLGTGETQEVPFDANSIVTVRTRIQRDPSLAPVDEDKAFSNVTGFEIVDADGAPALVEPAFDETTATPQAAIAFSASLALSDAATHIEKALVKFPGDEDLLAVHDEISAVVRGEADAVWPSETAVAAVAAETPVDTSVAPAEPDPGAPVEEAPVEEAPVEPAPVEPAPETLETPAAALEHAQTLPIEDAAAHIDAALAKFPGDPDLEVAKTDIASIISDSTPS